MDSDVSWAVLLAHWTDFVRASVALPDTGDAKRWKRCVSDVIGLQAITFALREIARIPPADRAGAIDRAGLGVRDHATRIHEAWGKEPLPEGLLELIGDAGAAVRFAGTLGTEWVVEKTRLVAPTADGFLASLHSRGFRGDVFLAPAGTLLFAGSPVAFASGWLGDVKIDGAIARDCAPQRQVYRQTDDHGQPVRDVVRLMHEELVAGQPLLVQVMREGEIVRRCTESEADDRRRAQERDIGGAGLPVDVSQS